MRIIKIGAKALLFNRLQCLRDVNVIIAGRIDELADHRDECCNPSSSSSSSSSGTALDNMLWSDGLPVQWSDAQQVEW